MNIVREGSAGKGEKEDPVIWELSSYSFTFRNMKKNSICYVLV